MNTEDKNYDSDSQLPLSKANKIAPHPFDTLSCLIMPSDGGVGISGNTGTLTNSYESFNQSSYLMENNMSFINTGSNFGVNNNVLPNYLVDQNGNLILLNGFANNNILVNNLVPQNIPLYNMPTNHIKSELSDNRISHSNNNLSLFDNNALQQLYLSQSSLVSHIANNNQSTTNNCTTTVNTDPYLNLLQQNVALIGQIINTNHELSSPTKLLQHSTPIKNQIYQQKLNSFHVKNDYSKAKDSLHTKYLQRSSSTSHSTKIEATLKSFVDEHFKDMESTWKTNAPPLHPPSQFNHTELLKLTSRSSVISNETGSHQSKGQGLYHSHNGFQDAKKQVKYETLKFKTKSERVKIRNRRYFGDDTSYDTTKINGDNSYASYAFDEESNLIVKEKPTSSPLRLSLSGSGGGNRRVMTRGGLPLRRQSRAGHERPYNSWYDRGRTSTRSRDSRDSSRRVVSHVTTHRFDQQAGSEEDEGEGEKDREALRIAQLIGCELEAYIRDFAPEEPPSPLPTDQLYKLWEMDLNTTSHECNIKRQITEEKNTILKIACLREGGFFCETIETTLNHLAFTDPIQALATHTTTMVESNQNASKLEATTNAIIPQSNEEEIPTPSKSVPADEIVVEEDLGTDKALVVLDEDSNPIAPISTTTTTSSNPVNSIVPRSLVISTEKTHENYMLEEMAWLSTDFLQEHKWKMTVARKVSRGIQKFFEERMLRDEKLKQEEMNYLKKIASRVSKIVWRFWRSISRIADAKAKAIFEIKHQRHLDRQLNAIVGETEKYSDQISKQLLPPPPPTTVNVPEEVETGGRPTIPKRRVRVGKDNEANASPPDSRRTSPRKFPVVKIHKLTEKSELLPATPEVVITSKPSTVTPPFKVGKRRKRRSADCILITESVRTTLPSVDEQVRLSVIMKHTIKVEELKPAVVKPLVRSLRSKNTGPPTPLLAEDSNSVVFDPSSASVQLNGARESVIKPCKPVRNGCIRAYSTVASPNNSINAMESKELLVSTEVTSKEPHSELVAFDTKMEEMEIKRTPPKLPLIKEESEDSSTDGSSPARSSDLIKEEDISIEMKDGEIKSDVPEIKDVPKKSLDAIEPESNPTEITDIAAQAQKFQPKGFTLATTEVCTKVPFLLKHTLREYQHIGLDWLVAMHNKNLNGILADEMGLGKTIQTISLLAHLACEKGIWGPHLIVVPTSVMLNWEMEFKKWCPGFKILTYFGSPKERRMKRKGWGFDASESRETPNVVITSYRLVLQDERCFKRKRWSYFVLDEAQNIKNFKSRRWLTLLNFKADHRLLLTGTPLQNDLMEVWSLMHFLMPRVFANRSEFSHWFVKPLQDLLDSSGQEPGSGSSRCMDASEILKGGPGGSTSSLSIHSGPSVAEAQALVAKLHKILRPFILRRLKREVEKQMPGKFEHVVACRLSKRQRYLYHDFVSRASTRQILESGNFLGVVNALMQLRKVCNHPDLFEERPICSPLITGRIMSYTAPSLATNTLNDDLKVYPSISPGSDPPETLEICENQRFKCLKLEGVKEAYDYHGLPKCAQEINSRALFNILLRHETKYRYVEALATSLAPGQIDLFHNPSSTLAQPLKIRGLLRPSLLSSFPNSNRILDLLARIRVASRILGVDDRSLDGSELYSPLINRLVMGDTNSYLESLQAILERFMIYIPPVTSLSPDLHVSHPSVPISRQELLCQTEDYLRLGLASMPLLKIITNARALRFPEIRLIEYDCGKLQVLKDLLAKLQIDKHRVLIFTQMTKVLDILESFLTYHGYRYLRLDGSTKIEQRQIMMDRFNYDPKIFCFILSTRSGGLGINLTGADTVIFYDSDWNPTMDAQAQDRCHRIGQTREVHIYRLISRYTVEENILKKARQKKLLGDITIEEGNFTTAFFRQDGLKDLFALKSSGEEMVVEEEEKKISNLDEDNAENIVESEKAEPAGKSSWFEEALGMAEDEADSKAARLAAREIPLDNEDLKAEFAEPNDESLADGGADVGQNSAKTELSPEEQFEKDLPEELKQYISNLKPIEKMALRIYEHLYCTELYETSATEDVSPDGEQEKPEKQSPSHDIDIEEEGSEDEIKSQGGNDTTSTESESGEDMEFGTISSFYDAKKGNNPKEEQSQVDDVKATVAPKRRRRKRFKAFRLSMPKRIKK